MDHPVARFFAADELTGLALSLTGRSRVTGIVCWTSVYRRGEFIGVHRDATGDIHVLGVSRGPASGRERRPTAPRPGTPEQVTLGLAPGDGVVFDVQRVPHRTTPLVAARNHRRPRRVVMIGRYFMI